VTNLLRPGDEVIVSALSWSTTIWPLVQHGLIPVIVDIDPNTLNIDPRKAKEAIGPRTKAIMPVHVYGNPCDMDAINELGLIVIQDCCESLGAPIGNSFLNTYSFYFSHHITTLEGGMVVAETEEIAELLRVLRAHGWTRDMKNPPKIDGFDNRFVFINAGYNLRASEVNAAMGLVQYPKLKGYVENRRKAAKMLTESLSSRNLAVQKDTGGSSWFGFPVTVTGPYVAERLRTHLENDGIETRSIICGNIARQPGMKLWPHRVVGDLKHADHVMRQGFSLPCHQDMSVEDCERIGESVRGFFNA